MNKLLSNIQSELVAPKGQFNAFGKYKYRSCEDILEALKPLLKKHNSTLTITDEIVNIGNRYYVKTKATLQNADGFIDAVAFAREAEIKKGMDEAQITGAASSYARKYALNGLFCIDDNKDADASHTNGNGSQVECIDDKQHSTLIDLIEDRNVDTGKFCKAYNIKDVGELPKNRYKEAYDLLIAKKKETK